MKRFRKMTLGLLFAALSLLILLGALEFLLPRMINLEPVQRTVFDELRNRLHCETAYRKIDFTLFPRPHLVARDVSIRKPGVFLLSVGSMTLYPEMGPLLTGDIRIRQVLFSKPDIQFSLPSPAVDANDVGHEPASGTLDQGLAGLSRLDAGIQAQLEFLRLAPVAPVLEIRGGRLALLRDGELLMDFADVQVHGERRAGRLELALGCGSNVCERVSLQAAVDQEEGTAYGQVILSGLNLDVLSSPFLKNASIHLGPSVSNLAVDLAYHRHRGLDLGFGGEVTELIVKKDERDVRFAGARFAARLALHGQTVRVTLDSLQMTAPKLQAGGFAVCEGRGRDIVVELTGTEVDAGGVRAVALGLWEENKGVRDTFEVLLGGRVPRIFYRVRGRSLKELEKLENTVIEGSMEGGAIFIPPARLLVQNARGEVEISAGVLRAWNLEGRTGGSSAWDGLLTLAIKKDADKDGPFHLDLQLDADLSGVPPVLRSTVKDQDFLEELTLIEGIGLPPVLSAKVPGAGLFSVND